MVFWGGGRRRGWGGPRYGRGWGGPGYGRGWGGPGYGPPPGPYGRGPGYGRYGAGGGSCLRDLFFLETGCCLAELLGCGPQLLFLAPAAVRAIGTSRAPGGDHRRTGPAAALVAAVRVYQRDISSRRAPCCRFTPSCSAYAITALERHGAWRGGLLAARRLLRCRPGAAPGADPVPARPDGGRAHR